MLLYAACGQRLLSLGATHDCALGRLRTAERTTRMRKLELPSQHLGDLGRQTPVPDRARSLWPEGRRVATTHARFGHDSMNSGAYPTRLGHSCCSSALDARPRTTPPSSYGLLASRALVLSTHLMHCGTPGLRFGLDEPPSSIEPPEWAQVQKTRLHVVAFPCPIHRPVLLTVSEDALSRSNTEHANVPVSGSCYALASRMLTRRP